MAGIAGVARLRYLDEASKALTSASPVVSSFLNASKRALDAECTNTGTDECSGCAQHIIPGLTGEFMRSTKIKQTRQDRLSGRSSEQRIRCSICGTQSSVKRWKNSKSKTTARQASTRKSVPKKPTHSSSQPGLETSLNPSTPTAAATLQATAPARRKARGKNTSLQALLANKKPDTPKKTYGDLMDFMKT